MKKNQGQSKGSNNPNNNARHLDKTTPFFYTFCFGFSFVPVTFASFSNHFK